MQATRTIETASGQGPSSWPGRTYQLDRRSSERHPISGQATAVRLDHDPQAYRRPLCSLRMRDISVGGLSAFSAAPLPPDAQVLLMLPGHGGEPAFERRGHVLRCQPAGQIEEGGYEVAIRFGVGDAA